MRWISARADMIMARKIGLSDGLTSANLEVLHAPWIASGDNEKLAHRYFQSIAKTKKRIYAAWYLPGKYFIQRFVCHSAVDASSFSAPALCFHGGVDAANIETRRHAASPYDWRRITSVSLPLQEPTPTGLPGNGN
jgi:hypothetical protein